MSSEDLRHQDSGLTVEPLLKGILSIAIMDLIKDKAIHGGEIYQSLKENSR